MSETVTQFRLVITPASPTVPTYVYRTSEKGRLKAVCCSFTAAVSKYGLMFVEVGAMLGGRGDEYIISIFYGGYVSERVRELWVGDYPLEAYMDIYVKGYAVVPYSMRLGFTIEV